MTTREAVSIGMAPHSITRTFLIILRVLVVFFMYFDKLIRKRQVCLLRLSQHVNVITKNVTHEMADLWAQQYVAVEAIYASWFSTKFCIWLYTVKQNALGGGGGGGAV